MAKYLKAIEVAELAERVASHIRIKIPPVDELSAKISKRRAIPFVISDSYIQLWVDKLYIAHSDIDDPNVHYVYLTDKHIDEEYRSYSTARRETNRDVFLPEYLDKVFKEALKEMRESEKNFVIYEIA